MARREKQRDRFASMVLLMGSTGSGKSFFINKLKENSTEESSSLYSCTPTCQLVQTRIGRTNLAVVDCPGFNDTKRSDTEILAEIAKVLSSQYLSSNKLRLRGILYLRDITKTRMEGSDVRTLEIFKKLVGTKAFPHIVFVTTMWDKLSDKSLGSQRERELKNDFWREMIDAGSPVHRFYGTKDSAEGIISQLIGDADPVVLQIQHELIDREMQLSATAAGSVLVPEVRENLDRSKSRVQRFRDRLSREQNSTVAARVKLDIERAEKEAESAQKDSDQLEEKVGVEIKKTLKDKLKGTWDKDVQVICSVLGVTLTIVMNVVLPVAGVSLACTVM